MRAEIYFACEFDPIGKDRCSRVEIFDGQRLDDVDLLGWRLRAACKEAIYGRFERWIALSSMGSLQPSPLVDPTRTVSMPATGPG